LSFNSFYWFTIFQGILVSGKNFTGIVTHFLSFFSI
jgi:hypothetical protein